MPESSFFEKTFSLFWHRLFKSLRFPKFPRGLQDNENDGEAESEELSNALLAKQRIEMNLWDSRAGLMRAARTLLRQGPTFMLSTIYCSEMFYSTISCHLLFFHPVPCNVRDLLVFLPPPNPKHVLQSRIVWRCRGSWRRLSSFAQSTRSP